jgi:RNA polymerase sigma factor (sigma-70 family)
MSSSDTTQNIDRCLERLRAGDVSARDDLLRHSRDRLCALTRRMLWRFPNVHRWEQTDDVLQQVLVRLDQMLDRLEVKTARDFYRLAATNIRRLLIDYARHYGGPRGLGANHATPEVSDRAGNGPVAQTAPEAESLLGWAEFHDRVNGLPDDEAEVFGLLWYHELTQDEAAGVLGISLSTLKRRWQSARIRLMEFFEGESPV